MHTHVMTDIDQDKAHELKNEILDLCLHRKVNTLVALAAARCAAECFESIINEQQGEVFTVDAATPPDTPSDAAMRAADAIANYVSDGITGMGNEVTETNKAEFLAIITRYLGATLAPVEEEK